MNIGFYQNSMAGTIAIPVLDTPQPLEPDNLDLDRPLAMRRAIRTRQVSTHLIMPLKGICIPLYWN
jgi:hypothetical protein